MDRRAFLMAAPSAILAGKALAIGKSPLPVIPNGPEWYELPKEILGTLDDPRIVSRIAVAARHAMKDIPYVIDFPRLRHDRRREMIRLYDFAVESVVGFSGPFVLSSKNGDMTHWGCCDHPHFEVLPGAAKIPARRIEFSDKLLESFGDKNNLISLGLDPKNDYWALMSYLNTDELYKREARLWKNRQKIS